LATRRKNQANPLKKMKTEYNKSLYYTTSV
jgi:hypothetical protein